MQRDKNKHRIVTFKAEEELAAFLDEMPNKSDFIRKALLSALMEPCPVCQGKGSVPRSLRADLQRILAKSDLVPCSFCGYEFPLKAEKQRKTGDDQARLKQYFGGGEFYCNDCYPRTQPCDDCGEHISGSRMAGHKRRHEVKGG